MALLKLGGLVTKISGRIGGNILGTGPNGSYIKSNSYSQQHPSAAQSLQRTQLYPITQLWRSLTPTQQAAWDTAKTDYPYTNKVGDVVYYTPYQLHNYLNQNLLLFGYTPLASPATYTAPYTPTLNTLTVTGSNIQLNVYPNDTVNSFVIYASAPQDFGTTPQLSKFRAIIYQNTTFTSQTIIITSQYSNIFTWPAIGQYIHFYIKAVNKNTGAPAPATQIISALRTV